MTRQKLEWYISQIEAIRNDPESDFDIKQRMDWVLRTLRARLAGLEPDLPAVSTSAQHSS